MKRRRGWFVKHDMHWSDGDALYYLKTSINNAVRTPRFIMRSNSEFLTGLVDTIYDQHAEMNIYAGK